MPSPGVLRLEQDQPAQPNQGLIIMLRDAGGEPGPGGVADEEHRPDAGVGRCRRQKIVDSEVAVGLERHNLYAGCDVVAVRTVEGDGTVRSHTETPREEHTQRVLTDSMTYGAQQATASTHE